MIYRIFQLHNAILVALFVLTLFPSASSAEPATSKYGIYLTRLDDFDIRDKSFFASFWLFTVAHDPKALTPSAIEFPNAVDIEATNQFEENIDGRFLLQERVQGTFRHAWDLGNYPFVRQTLRIEFESVNDVTKVLYEPDIANTNYDKSISIDGWRIVSVQMIPQFKKYVSNFGDPRLQPGWESEYSKLALEVTVEQSDISAFVTLVITPVIAILITLITYLLLSRDLGLLTARLSLLVGSIFAVVISMRSAAAELGSISNINLLDVIHIAALLYITVGIIAAVQSWWALKKDSDAEQMQRVSNWIAVLSTAAVVISIAISLISAHRQVF